MVFVFDFHAELKKIRQQREEKEAEYSRQSKQEGDDYMKQRKIERIEAAKPILETFLSKDAMHFVEHHGPFDLTTSTGVSKFKRKIMLITHPDKQRPECIYHDELSSFFEAYKKWENDLDETRKNPFDWSEILPQPSVPQQPQQQQSQSQQPQQPQQQQHDSPSRPTASFTDIYHRVDLIEDICIDDTKDLTTCVSLRESNTNLDAIVPLPSFPQQSSTSSICKDSRKKSKKRHQAQVTSLDRFSKKPRQDDDDDFHQDKKVEDTRVKIECKTMEVQKKKAKLAINVKKTKTDPNWLKLAKSFIQYAKEKNVQGEFRVTDIYDTVFRLYDVKGNTYADKKHEVRNWQTRLKTLLKKQPLCQLMIDGHGTMEQILTKKNEGKNNSIRYRVVQFF